MKKLVTIALSAMLMIGLMSGKDKPVKVFIAGDSTAADKEEIAFPETGWGQVLPSYFNDKVIVENHARNGRSTRTFISEGRWDYLINRVSKGDYVVIQFGHNDQSKKKQDRYTTPEDFKKNFEKMVKDVRAKGATPILCTPIERRKFDKSDNFVDQHGNYPNLIRQVAKEQGTILIDMQHESMDWMIEQGREGSKQFFLHVKPGECKKHPEGKEDNTHLKPIGAMAMAKIFVDGVKSNKSKALKGLQKNIIENNDGKITYTTQLEEIKKLGKNTNNKLDEGEKGQK